MIIEEIIDNLTAIRAICDNDGIDDDDARGMASLIASTIRSALKMVEANEDVVRMINDKISEVVK